MTDTANIQNPTDWSDYDFLEFEGFVHKIRWEGSYSYAAENYGPEFESPELQEIADDPAKLRALYRENRQKVDDWYETVGGQRACDLHNAHVDEQRQRRQDACLFGIRCTDGYVIHYATEQERNESDAFLRANQGGRASYRMPEALLRRDVPGGDWTDDRPAVPTHTPGAAMTEPITYPRRATEANGTVHAARYAARGFTTACAVYPAPIAERLDASYDQPVTCTGCQTALAAAQPAV